MKNSDRLGLEPPPIASFLLNWLPGRLGNDVRLGTIFGRFPRDSADETKTNTGRDRIIIRTVSQLAKERLS